MKTIPLILIALAALALFVIVSVIIYVIRKRGSEFKEGLALPIAPTEDTLVRRENIERVLALVRHRYEVSVSDVQDMLGFTRAMSEGYLAELSTKGVVEPVGKTGRGEVFRIK